MKWVVPAAAAVVLLYVGGRFLSGSDVVTSRYESLSDARADRLFERGWLPDILPLTSRSIRTSNNLDLNTSEGEFSFAKSEYAGFAGRLRQYEPMRTPFSNFEAAVAEKRADGFQLGVFEDSESIWVFSCKPEDGYCEYTMWLRRG
jgi:hypothetical protein